MAAWSIRRRRSAGSPRAAGIPFLLDACQSAGQMPLDVEELGCDLLSAPGASTCAGRAAAASSTSARRCWSGWIRRCPTCTRRDWVARDRYELRPDARRFENWEFNYAAVIGLGVAVDYALGWGLEAIEDRVVKLAHHLRLRLDEELGLPVYDLGARKCGIVTTALPGIEAAELRNRLHAQGINASHSTPDSTRIDAEKRELPDLLRLSVHYYNSEDEIDRLIQALREIKG